MLPTAHTTGRPASQSLAAIGRASPVCALAWRAIERFTHQLLPVHSNLTPVRSAVEDHPRTARTRHHAGTRRRSRGTRCRAGAWRAAARMAMTHRPGTCRCRLNGGRRGRKWPHAARTRSRWLSRAGKAKGAQSEARRRGAETPCKAQRLVGSWGRANSGGVRHRG